MNINPGANASAAASVAGTSRAAARGGEADNQATEATRQQAAADSPAGKSQEATVDAGEQTNDRGGNGRQVLDVFEREEQDDLADQEEQQPATQKPTSDGAGEHLDLEA